MKMQTLKCLFAFGAMLAGGLAFGDGFGTLVGEASEVVANFDTRNLKVRKPATMDEFFNVAWNNTAGWTAGGNTGAGAPSAKVTIEPMSGTDREDYAGWASAGASKEVVSAPGEGDDDVSGHLRRSLYRFTLAVEGIEPLFAYFDFGDAVPEVKPSVEITSVRLRDPRDGTVEYSYKVDGDVEGVYDLHIKVSVANGTKSTVVTHESVAGGRTVSTNLNVQTLFGKAYPNVALFATIEKHLGGVQLWKDGPYFAECNVGASKPEEFGYYFWWDDTVGYVRNEANDGWVSADGKGTPIQFNSSDATASPTIYRFDNDLQSDGWIDADCNLVAAHDAATVHLGEPWRMPTKDEIQALVDNTTYTYENNWNGTGVGGLTIVGKGAYESKRIFFPFPGYGISGNLKDGGQKGYYGSATSNSKATNSSFCLRVAPNSRGLYDSVSRVSGLPVRPVRDAAK